MLRFLVEERLAGRADRLKGFTIAVAVFGRDETCDAQSDPIVRLEARRLRHDLDSYYVGEGNQDSIRIAIPKGGYVPQFEWQGHERPHRAPGSDARDAGPETDRIDDRIARLRPGARVLVTLAAVMILLAAAGAWLWARGAPRSVEPGADGPAVIVLPFESLSSDEDGRFLAGGITQELITSLMRFEGLRLFSVQASFRQDPRAEPGALEEDLGVAYVVKGGVQSDGPVVRVSAQLVDARSGEMLWSRTLNRERVPGRLLDLQAELATNIATALGQPYGIVQNDLQHRLAAAAATDMEGYACVLRAYEYRRSHRSDLYRPALACLDDAVRRAPDYALGWAMLAHLRIDAILYALVPDADAPQELQRARDMALKAVALDETSVVALRALSAAEFLLENFEESERIQRRALALNPNDPDTMAQLGNRLAARGKWGEALPYLDSAISRTISPPSWYYVPIAIHLLLDEKYAEMLPYAEKAAAGDPLGSALLAIAQGALGNEEAAREALAEMARLSPAYARDPDAFLRRYRALDSIVDAQVQGLRNAGWTPPGG
jgi:TolB-like protein